MRAHLAALAKLAQSSLVKNSHLVAKVPKILGPKVQQPLLPLLQLHIQAQLPFGLLELRSYCLVSLQSVDMQTAFLGGMLDANVHLQCLLALEAPLSIPLRATEVARVGASCSSAHQPQISTPIRAHLVFRSVLRQGIVASPDPSSDLEMS